jgi:uncharacterized membrane protein YdjX (TVP38/TMEM64 family)
LPWLLVAVAALFVSWLVVPVDRIALEVAAWLRRSGLWGALAYALLYTPGSILLIPSAAFTLGAGFAYGPLLGMLLAVPSATFAGAVVFTLSRSLLRAEVQKRFAGTPLFVAIDRAVAKHGIKTVILLRLSPVTPFNVLNYVFGLTRLTLAQYVIASAIGVVPGAALYAYLGSLVTSAASYARGERPDAGPVELVLYWAGLIATIVIVIVLGRVARRELARELGPGAPHT